MVMKHIRITISGQNYFDRLMKDKLFNIILKIKAKIFNIIFKIVMKDKSVEVVTNKNKSVA